jgi:hypothetical protein
MSADTADVLKPRSGPGGPGEASQTAPLQCLWNSVPVALSVPVAARYLWPLGTWGTRHLGRAVSVAAR